VVYEAANSPSAELRQSRRSPPFTADYPLPPLDRFGRLRGRVV